MIGLTVVSFWKRFGDGEAGARPVTDLARLIDEATVPMQRRLQAA